VATTVGLAAILELVTAIAHVHGWLWTGLRAANAVVFILACLVVLIGWVRQRLTRS
jgi:hypothetical protein